MTLSFILILVLFVFIFVVIKDRSNTISWLIMLALITTSFGLGYMPDLMLHHLQTYPQVKTFDWKPKNLIVLLGGGETNWGDANAALSPETYGLTRIMEALKQYQSCKKQNVICNILISGGDPLNKGQSEALTYKNKLVELGVEPEDTFLEDKSKTTIENAELAGAAMKKEEYDLKILVTSGFHMTRALLSFIQAGVTDLQPAPADFLQASFAPYPNATNFYLVNLSFHEYFGMAQVFLKAKSPDLYKKTLNIF